MGIVNHGTVNGQILQQESSGTATQLVPDTLGSVARARSASGSILYSVTYWPFGEVRTESGTNPAPFGFVGTLGYYRESPTKMYVRARMYDAARTAWTTVDPYWPGQKAYGYVNQVPTKMTDLIGRSPGYGNYFDPRNRPGTPVEDIDKYYQTHNNCMASVWDWINPCKAFQCDCALAWCVANAKCKPFDFGCLIAKNSIGLYATAACIARTPPPPLLLLCLCLVKTPTSSD
ncbi:hypothetical protein BH11ARM2_BH11ARM2_32350 [soil metagenome]